jgi:hypothetical protein
VSNGGLVTCSEQPMRFTKSLGFTGFKYLYDHWSGSQCEVIQSRGVTLTACAANVRASYCLGLVSNGVRDQRTASYRAASLQLKAITTR